MNMEIKPESVALLLRYLQVWANKEENPENGCKVSSSHNGYDIKAGGIHMMTLASTNPTEKEILMAFRILCLESNRKQPIRYVIAGFRRSKDDLERLLSRLNEDYFTQQEAAKIRRCAKETREWLSTLDACLAAVHREEPRP